MSAGILPAPFMPSAALTPKELSWREEEKGPFFIHGAK
jgi:hypothetical protein